MAAAAAVSRQLLEGSFVEDVPLSFLKRCTRDFAEERKVGSGTFGTVYKGVDTENGHCFAVKVINPQVFQQVLLRNDGLSDASEDRLQRIVRAETDAFRALPQTHPNLCRLLGICSGRHPGNGSPYVMILSALGHKGDLASLLQKDADARILTWQDRVSVARQIAKAVSFLHGQSPRPIFHRDLKSANIVMTNSLKPMLIDWALARLIPEGAQSHKATTEAFSVGTRGFMCPQYAAEGVFTSESEVYSLGVVLLELFTGRTQRPPESDLVKEFAGEDLFSRDADAPPTVHPLGVEDADSRAGEWDQRVATEFASLILDCLQKKRRRVSLPSVLRSLSALEALAEAARPGEEALRRELAVMREAQETQIVEREVTEQRAHEEKVTCSACLESVSVGEGAVCPRGKKEHFLCRGCFSDHVKHEAESGLRMVEGELLLPCPLAGRGCESGAYYDQRVVALNCSAESYRHFRESRDRDLREEGRRVAEAEIRREDRVGRERRRLEEELSHFSHTPCCNRPFVFDGCAAVMCVCGMFFCALCHFTSRYDSHDHVGVCDLNPVRGEVFISTQRLERVHRPLLAQRVRALLADLQRDHPEVFGRLVEEESVQRHLIELDIDPQEDLRRPPPAVGFDERREMQADQARRRAEDREMREEEEEQRRLPHREGGWRHRDVAGWFEEEEEEEDRWLRQHRWRRREQEEAAGYYDEEDFDEDEEDEWFGEYREEGDRWQRPGDGRYQHDWRREEEEDEYEYEERYGGEERRERQRDGRYRDGWGREEEEDEYEYEERYGGEERRERQRDGRYRDGWGREEEEDEYEYEERYGGEERRERQRDGRYRDGWGREEEEDEYEYEERYGGEERRERQRDGRYRDGWGREEEEDEYEYEERYGGEERRERQRDGRYRDGWGREEEEDEYE
eukprot:Cvel_15366.t1-p1 / transcript=Cvel_15366.t1 / gene=Cvel_15366 / organism=Chromera_velia_CCMP2878 / gene_product=Serine/threonine-protein kinase PBS1, putative / transcript_product=Serine/threonine-protein kinase PBS1, putative / location=Cvel_scaffold1132:51663-54398(+) / protein_length=912 / sequence_SO=supercontig / SO=protein_coding / is_pseudo=false